MNFIAAFLILSGICLLVFLRKHKEKKREKHVAKNIAAAEYSAKSGSEQIAQMDEADQQTLSARQVKYAAQIQDHNLKGDDVTEVKNYHRLDRYQKFEKLFPFWRMDINGFMMYVKEAVHVDVQNQRHPGHQQYNAVDSAILGIKIVSIEALAAAFSNHASWADLADPNSYFVQYLKDNCGVADEDLPVGHYDCNFIDIQKLKLMAILLCEGSPKEKAFELYDSVQDNFQERIACSDKDFEPAFFHLLDLATELVFYWEPIYMQTSAPCKADKYDQSNVRNTYRDILEEFLDEVFDADSTLARKDWEKLLVQKQKWILDPAAIRKKLYPQVQSWDE